MCTCTFSRSSSSTWMRCTLPSVLDVVRFVSIMKMWRGESERFFWVMAVCGLHMVILFWYLCVRSGHQLGSDLHSSGLQHPPFGHHLQQLCGCPPCGAVLPGEWQAPHSLLHLRSLRQDHRQLSSEGPSLESGPCFLHAEGRRDSLHFRFRW